MILDDINLELAFGNIYGFIGANGSGKSVFFKTICGFLKAEKYFPQRNYNDWICAYKLTVISYSGKNIYHDVIG